MQQSLNANAKAFVPNFGGTATPAPAAFAAAAPLPPAAAASGVPVAAAAAMAAASVAAATAAPNEPTWFRYSVALPAARTVVELGKAPVASPLPPLALLLSKRQLVSSPVGGTTVAALGQFVKQAFEKVENTAAPSTAATAPQPTPSSPFANNARPCGFLISRELLSLSTPEAVNEIDQRDGFIMRVNVPTGAKADVAPTLASAWEALFAHFGNDYRVVALGYVMQQDGHDEAHAQFRHYFFAATTPKSEQLVPLTAADFSGVAPLIIPRAVAAKQVLALALSPRAAITVAVLCGAAASTPAISEAADLFVSLRAATPAAMTEAVSAMTSTIEAAVSNRESALTWARTNLVVVCLHTTPPAGAAAAAAATADGGEGDAAVPVPLGDVLTLIRSACSAIMASIVVVAGASPAQLQGIAFCPTTAVGNSAELTAAVVAAVERPDAGAGFSFGSDAPLGGATATPIVSPSEYLAVRRLLSAARAQQQHGAATAPAMPLTRATYAGAVDAVAREPYVVRRTVVGTPVFIVADGAGKGYVVDAVRGYALALHHMAWPNCAAVGSSPPQQQHPPFLRDCVLCATQTAALRGDEKQVRLIVHDVLFWAAAANSGAAAEVGATLDFARRWQLVEQSALDDETSWPHGSPVGVVALRCVYAPLQSMRQLLFALPQSEHPTLGVTLVAAKHRAAGKAAAGASFVYVPAEATTVFFGVGAVSAVDGDPKLSRATLCVLPDAAAAATAPATSWVPFNGEFVDFSVAAAPELRAGCLVECALRRVARGGAPSSSASPSTAAAEGHWWDLLRDFAPGHFPSRAPAPARLAAAARAVAASGITVDELLWLATASAHVCATCGQVSDAGSPDELVVVSAAAAASVSPSRGAAVTSAAQPLGTLLNPLAPPPSGSAAANVVRAFVCRACLDASGRGNCGYCGARSAVGGADTTTGRFYCETCWGLFSTPRSFPAGAPPPPPDALFSRQVSTRIVSLLIDSICGKGPTSDVLELCCGGAAVARKWIMAGASRYIGVDVRPGAVEEQQQHINQHLRAALTAPQPQLPQLQLLSGQPSTPSPSQQQSPAAATGASSRATAPSFSVYCANAFARSFWTTDLLKVHPQPFHTITCFSGLHHAFDTEQHAREVLSSVAGALVPNGLFVGCVALANTMFNHGRSFNNGVVAVAWPEGCPAPRMGSTYVIAVDVDARAGTRAAASASAAAAAGSKSELNSPLSGPAGAPGAAASTTSDTVANGSTASGGSFNGGAGAVGLEGNEEHVVPIDVLVALAAEYGLALVRELCTPFGEMLAKDPKWLRSQTPEEKEALTFWTTFVFRKASQRASAATASSPTSSAPSPGHPAVVSAPVALTV